MDTTLDAESFFIITLFQQGERAFVFPRRRATQPAAWTWLSAGVVAGASSKVFQAQLGCWMRGKEELGGQANRDEPQPRRATQCIEQR